MTKCKYCYMDKDGDIPHDRKYLFNKTILKPTGSIPIKLYATIIGNTMYVDTDRDLFEFGAKIKYCPMCGRKLEGV